MNPPRILVTRAPHQASALADILRARGCTPILIPTIEFGPPTTYKALDVALANLHTFDWLLFTSANAVGAFAQRLQETNIVILSEAKDLLLSRGTKLAAIGPATARALDSIGLSANLIPPQAVAESLAEALLPYALTSAGTPTRFLLIRAQLLRDKFTRDPIPHILRAAGAGLTIAPAYRTLVPPGSIPAVQRLFANPATWPDAITFTSSSTATNLLSLLTTAGLQLPAKIPRISIGPITTQTLRDLGYPAHAEAAIPGVPALVEAVLKTVASRRIMP